MSTNSRLTPSSLSSWDVEDVLCYLFSRHGHVIHDKFGCCVTEQRSSVRDGAMPPVSESSDGRNYKLVKLVTFHNFKCEHKWCGGEGGSSKDIVTNLEDNIV